MQITISQKSKHRLMLLGCAILCLIIGTWADFLMGNGRFYRQQTVRVRKSYRFQPKRCSKSTKQQSELKELDLFDKKIDIPHLYKLKKRVAAYKKGVEDYNKEVAKLNDPKFAPIHYEPPKIDVGGVRVAVEDITILDIEEHPKIQFQFDSLSQPKQ